MNRYLLKLPENRARRNYTGGAAIDMLKRKAMCKDGNQPEEWLASTVSAKNPGMEIVEDEGLSFIYDGQGNKLLLSELFQSNAEFYLGAKHFENYGANTGFLAKLLDSAIRLHVQAHPSREYAQKHLNSRYGKLECYYILGVRPGYEPYIRLGFQKAPSKEEWKRIIETQDIIAMDACFKKIPVKPGEIWYVPGGLPHAIGEGLLMLEVMEPSDLVLRCEFEREGIVVPPEARFMGKDAQTYLDIFDYNSYSVEEITEKFRLLPITKVKNNQYTLEQLTDSTITDSFFIEKLTLNPNVEISLSAEGSFGLYLVCQGEVEIESFDEKVTLKSGESCFVSAANDNLVIKAINNSSAELCIILNSPRS